MINVAGRALWGLGQGVPPELQPRVAAAVRQLFEARSDPYTRKSALDLLSQYGTAAEAEKLEAMAAQPAISKDDREAVAKALQAIRARLPK